MRRFIKFVDSLSKNKRPEIQALLQFSYKDVRTTTGANLKHILSQTGSYIIPGVTKPNIVNDKFIYPIPDGEEWKIGFILSMIETRNHKWTVLFDEEDDKLSDDEIEFMLNNICTS